MQQHHNLEIIGYVRSVSYSNNHFILHRESIYFCLVVLQLPTKPGMVYSASNLKHCGLYTITHWPGTMGWPHSSGSTHVSDTCWTAVLTASVNCLKCDISASDVRCTSTFTKSMVPGNGIGLSVITSKGLRKACLFSLKEPQNALNWHDRCLVITRCLTIILTVSSFIITSQDNRPPLLVTRWGRIIGRKMSQIFICGQNAFCFTKHKFWPTKCIWRNAFCGLNYSCVNLWHIINFVNCQWLM